MLQRLGGRAKTEDSKIREAFLDHIDQPVIALRIRWNHEEPRMADEAATIADKTFDHLSIAKYDPYPKAVKRWDVIVEAQVLMRFAGKGFDKEHTFRTNERNLSPRFGLFRAHRDTK